MGGLGNVLGLGFGGFFGFRVVRMGVWGMFWD